MTANPTVSSGRLIGVEGIASVQSLSRTAVNVKIPVGPFQCQLKGGISDGKPSVGGGVGGRMGPIEIGVGGGWSTGEPIWEFQFKFAKYLGKERRMNVLIILIAGVLSGVDDPNIEAHKNMDKIIDDFVGANTKSDLEKVIEKVKKLNDIYADKNEVKGPVKENYSLISRDLDYFYSLSSEKQRRFFDLKAEFTKVFFTRNANPAIAYPSISKYCESFCEEFPESVFLKNFILIRKGYFMAMFVRDGKILDELLGIAAVLEDQKVANSTSVVGNFFEVIGCYYLIRAFDYKNSLIWFEKAEKHNLKFYSESDLNMYTDYAYISKCLGEESRVAEASNKFDMLSADKFEEVLNGGDSYFAFVYFSGKSILLLNKGKLKASVEFQITALYFLEKIPNANRSLITAEASRLRDLYFKSKELTSMRNLESQYDLKPIPKQVGE